MFNVGTVVQFNEKHKWCGCFGFITETKVLEDDVRYMVGVPVPQKGTAYIFVMQSTNEIEFIGHSLFMPGESDE